MSQLSQLAMRRFLAFVATSLVALALVMGQSLAHAQGAETEEEQARRAMELNREIMSPFCPGRTLDGCSSSQAGVWREEVRRWVAEGKTNQEIKKLLAARTDKDLTGAPSTAMDSVLPVLVIVVALLVLIALLRVLVKPDRAAKPKQKPDRKGEAAKPAEDYDQRLDDELAGLDD